MTHRVIECLGAQLKDILQCIHFVVAPVQIVDNDELLYLCKMLWMLGRKKALCSPALATGQAPDFRWHVHCPRLSVIRYTDSTYRM